MWLMLAALVVLAIQVARNWDTVQRVFLGGVKVYETTPPALPANLPHPAILVFSKTNAFRHEEAIPAGNALFQQIAKDKGWGYFQTENGATFSPELLAKFDMVVFNNTSGDVFTPQQRAAFKAFVENGGGYLGIHAAGDNSHKAWGWYMDKVIGTEFTGHPMDPQFQQATMHIEDRTHPATKHLGETWQRTDEWYSFNRSPRGPGIQILATLDEASYKPGSFFGTELGMGKDHPIAWSRCVGKGRALYTALGHTAEAFSEPEYKQMLLGALNWGIRLEGQDCDAPVAAQQAEKAE